MIPMKDTSFENRVKHLNLKKQMDSERELLDYKLQILLLSATTKECCWPTLVMN